MSRRTSSSTWALIVALAVLGFGRLISSTAAQNPAPAPVENSPTVIKAETNLVLVDVIATDKKGNYVRDLEQKDFHVFQDGTEQTISTFSREADIQPNAPGRPRYMVLFFDDSTLEPEMQMWARQAAGKFVESTASPNRQMAVVDFSGTLKIAQNFTADSDLLKHAVSNVKMANVSASSASTQIASTGAPSLGRAEYDFGARTMLLSMREVAKLLRDVPGRKTLILFSAGFPLTADRQSELTATIDALNKANIAVYPVDARGLAVMPIPGMIQPGQAPRSELHGSFPHLPGLWAALVPPPLPDPQRPGGGGGGMGGGGGAGGGGGSHGGGTSGGGSSGGSSGGASGGGSHGSSGSGGSTGGSGSGHGSAGAPGTGRGSTGNNPTGTRPGGGASNYNNYNQNNAAACMNATLGGIQNPNCPNRQIIPQIPDSVSTNQQVLYALAKGTGGFTIFNTNDFLQGLEKVSKEMNEYYNLGYTFPNPTHDGSYHKISVKVDRSDIALRYRGGYYDVKGADLLKGKPEGATLETQLANPQAGDIPVSLSVPYFYVEPGVARVNLALSVPGSAVDFTKQGGAFHSDVNILGIAYRENGSIAARFSDSVKLDFPKKEAKDFAKSSFDYQNNFNIAPGSYTLKVALTAGGQKFAKYSVPLKVDPFTGNEFSLGGPAFGNDFVPLSQLSANMDSALMEERAPLVCKGMQLLPSTNSRFPKAGPAVVYVEVYDPVLKGEQPSRVGVMFDILDKKTNQQVYSSNTILIDEFIKPGNPLVPVGLKLPMDKLQAGDYRFEIKGRDDHGNVSSVRSAEFSIE